METAKALKCIETGDRKGLADWVNREKSESATAEERRQMTRLAARSGQAGILRDLFERYHLYETEPDETDDTIED